MQTLYEHLQEKGIHITKEQIKALEINPDQLWDQTVVTEILDISVFLKVAITELVTSAGSRI